MSTRRRGADGGPPASTSAAPSAASRAGGSVRPTGAPWWRPLPTVAPRPGTRGRGTGLALTRHQVAGTWLARWAEGDKAPGLILTEGLRAEMASPEGRAANERVIRRLPLGRAGEPDDIAHAVVFLASPAARYITGQLLVVDGGYSLGAGVEG